MIDKNKCMSQYLAFRYISDENLNFYEGLKHEVYKGHSKDEITKVKTIDDMDKVIRHKIEEFYVPNKTAILLSGGIDSAVLASYMPKGTKAYTFHCVAEGAIDEREQAKKYCDIYGLEQEVIDMNWSDFEELTPEILKADGVPFHSIEVQLLKAAKYAKSQGIKKIIIGDSADYVFGGMDKLLTSDWNTEAFIKRYNYIEPSEVLKNPVDVRAEYNKYKKSDNTIDVWKLMNEDMLLESLNSYTNAFKIAGIEYLDPYSYMKMAEPLDLNRIRNGEPKYMVRELFAKRYPTLDIPTKIPMPRATNQWLKNYTVSRPEFISNCTENMTGDQKWLCWCLEQFLNMHEPMKEVVNV